MARMAQPGRRPMAPPPRRKLGAKFWLYTALIGVTLVAIALPTLIVFIVGMLPGLASWVTDRTDQKYGFFCIGGLNFAGVFPYLMDLWWGNHTLSGATDIITNVFSLAVMYGAAMAGWFIYTVVPPTITSFMTVLAERRLSALRANQRRIVEEWGEEVTMGLRAPGDSGPKGAPTPGQAMMEPDAGGDVAPPATSLIG